MEITLEKIIVAGIHIGHRVQDCNPKIVTYTYGSMNGFHLIDIVKTYAQLEKAKNFLIRNRRDGKKVLFIGAKNHTIDILEERAISSQIFFVTGRWLGGTLTNWTTVKISLLQLHRLTREEKRGVWSNYRKKYIISQKKKKKV